MKRGYTTLECKSKIRKLRKIRPDIALSCDFIIGFPGETDQACQATLDLIKSVGFDRHTCSFVVIHGYLISSSISHTYSYSRHIEFIDVQLLLT